MALQKSDFEASSALVRQGGGFKETKSAKRSAMKLLQFRNSL
jgi:hypothetical protein